MSGDQIQSGDMNMGAFSENASQAYSKFIGDYQNTPKGNCANGGCPTGEGEGGDGDGSGDGDGGGGGGGGGGMMGGLLAGFAQKILSGIMSVGRSLIG